MDVMASASSSAYHQCIFVCRYVVCRNSRNGDVAQPAWIRSSCYQICINPARIRTRIFNFVTYTQLKRSRVLCWANTSDGVHHGIEVGCILSIVYCRNTLSNTVTNLVLIDISIKSECHCIRVGILRVRVLSSQ